MSLEMNKDSKEALEEEEVHVVSKKKVRLWFSYLPSYLNVCHNITVQFIWEHDIYPHHIMVAIPVNVNL